MASCCGVVYRGLRSARFEGDYGRGGVRPRGPGAPRARAGARPFLLVGKHSGGRGSTSSIAFGVARGRSAGRASIVGPAELELDQPGVTVLGRISTDKPGGTRLGDLFRDATVFVMPSFSIRSGWRSSRRWPTPCRPSAAPAGAMPELIADGSTGFLIEPGDEAVLERMRRLATTRCRAAVGTPPAGNLYRGRFTGTRRRTDVSGHGRSAHDARGCILSCAVSAPAWRGDQVRVLNLVRALGARSEAELLFFGRPTPNRSAMSTSVSLTPSGPACDESAHGRRRSARTGSAVPGSGMFCTVAERSRAGGPTSSTPPCARWRRTCRRAGAHRHLDLVDSLYLNMAERARSSGPARTAPRSEFESAPAEAIRAPGGRRRLRLSGLGADRSRAGLPAGTVIPNGVDLAGLSRSWRRRTAAGR